MPENRQQYQNLRDDSPTQEGAVPHSTTTPVLPSAPAVKARDKHKISLLCLGIFECIVGGLSIVFAIATLSTSRFVLAKTSQGLWSGIFLVVTGILGTCAMKNPSVVMYKANMVLSILTIAFTMIGAVVSGLAALVTDGRLTTLHVIITAMLFVGFIISIIHSAYCCAGLCGQRHHPGIVVYIPQVPTSQQIGGIPNAQYVVPGGVPSIQQHYNAQLMQPVVHHQVQAAVPPRPEYGNQGMSTNVQYSGAQFVPHV